MYVPVALEPDKPSMFYRLFHDLENCKRAEEELAAYHKSLFADLLNDRSLPDIWSATGESNAESNVRILQALVEKIVLLRDDKIDDANVDTSSRLMGTKGKASPALPPSHIMPAPDVEDTDLPADEWWKSENPPTQPKETWLEDTSDWHQDNHWASSKGSWTRGKNQDDYWQTSKGSWTKGKNGKSPLYAHGKGWRQDSWRKGTHQDAWTKNPKQDWTDSSSSKGHHTHSWKQWDYENQQWE